MMITVRTGRVKGILTSSLLLVSHKWTTPGCEADLQQDEEIEEGSDLTNLSDRSSGKSYMDIIVCDIDLQPRE